MTIFARNLSFFVILVFGIGSAILPAQVQAINGSIQGDVIDAGGAVIPDAAVEADEVDTAVAQTTVTDGSGHFQFLSLKPGRYVVKISKPGFANTIQENLTLTVGRTTTLRLTLQVAGTSSSITWVWRISRPEPRSPGVRGYERPRPHGSDDRCKPIFGRPLSSDPRV